MEISKQVKILAEIKILAETILEKEKYGELCKETLNRLKEIVK